MITRSGVHVFPNGTTAPTISDMAVSLGRIPRFAGHTTTIWTVADHLLVCHEYGRMLRYGKTRRLHLLLHDAHESVIGDIPSTWCIPEINKIKEQLDRRIYSSLKLALPSSADHAFIKHIDQISVVAEAKIIGPESAFEWFDQPVDNDMLDIVRNHLGHASSATLRWQRLVMDLLPKPVTAP